MPQADREIYERSTHTRCRVAFYTDAANGFNTELPIEAAPHLGQIVSCTTAKQLGSASGTWQITIKKDQHFQGPRSALRDLWKDPEDVWVRIFFIVDGQRIDTMLGLVDSIREDTRRQGQGQRSETYTISGRDFGKVFETTELFVNLHQSSERPLMSISDLMNTFLEEVENTPEGFVRVLIDGWIGNHGAAEQQWRLPQGLGGGFFSELLSQEQIQEMEPLVNGTIVSPSLFQIDQTGGKLWDVLQEYSNGSLNELFCDLGPNGRGNDLSRLTPCLYLRERPFPTYDVAQNTTSNRKWAQLRTRVLKTRDVAMRNITKGGAAHRFNYWQLQLQGIGSEGFGIDEILQNGVAGVEPGFPGNIPIWNRESIAKHGLRRYVLTTKFIPYYESEEDAGNFFNLAAAWLKKAHDWFAVAPFELTGRITTSRVMPEIRVGERLKEQRVEGTITYYVEGVEHVWSYPNAGATHLTLTRGEYDDGDLLEYLYHQYEQPQALSAQEACLIPLDASLEEIEDGYARGCGFELPTTLRAVTLGLDVGRFEGGVSEGSGFAVEETLPGNAQRTLSAEVPTSGRVRAPASPDPGMMPGLDDSSPGQIGAAGEIPPPGPTADPPGTPVLDRGRLQRGEPIGGLEGLDDSTDPIAGLEDEGLF